MNEVKNEIDEVAINELQNYKELTNKIEDPGVFLTAKVGQFAENFIKKDGNKYFVDMTSKYLKKKNGKRQKYGEFNINSSSQKKQEQQKSKHICSSYFATDKEKRVIPIYDNLFVYVFDNSTITTKYGATNTLVDQHDDVNINNQPLSDYKPQPISKKALREIKNNNKIVLLDNNFKTNLRLAESDKKNNKNIYLLNTSINSIDDTEHDNSDEERYILNLSNEAYFQIQHNLVKKCGSTENTNGIIDDNLLSKLKKHFQENLNNGKYSNEYYENGFGYNEFQIKPKSYEENSLSKVPLKGIFLNYVYAKKANKKIFDEVECMKQLTNKYILVWTEEGFRVLDKANFTQDKQDNLESYFLTIDDAIAREERQIPQSAMQAHEQTINDNNKKKKENNETNTNEPKKTLTLNEKQFLFGQIPNDKMQKLKEQAIKKAQKQSGTKPKDIINNTIDYQKVKKQLIIGKAGDLKGIEKELFNLITKDYKIETIRNK